MQSSKEQQGELREPSSAINAKKQRKTIECKRVEISSRKLEIPREHFMKRWAQYRTNMVRTYQKHKILRKGGKNTQNYTKRSSRPRYYNGGITHLEPGILECEVKWALGSTTVNKASESDRIPVELFQILKDDAVKVLHSICQQIWKSQQWPQECKRSVFIPIPKKGNAKECSNYAQLHPSHMLAK